MTAKISNISFSLKKKLYCLIGNPTRNSLSPVMHNAIFDYFNYNGVYFPVTVNDIESTINDIRALNIMGCSVTTPYKISVMDYLDFIDKSAVEIGAVNTIINKKGILTGYNFDCDGSMAALLKTSYVKGRIVVLLGSGGAARAIGYGIKKNGGNLIIINRTESKGKRLAHDLNADFCTMLDIFEIKPNIIINATSVGMPPIINSMPIPKKVLNSNITVMDIVYNPFETMLLKTAKKIGCKTVNGLEMLSHQGALQFECWTKIKPSLDFIEKTLLNSII